MKWIELTQEQYDALIVKDRYTFYCVKPSATREIVDFIVFKDPDKNIYDSGESLDLTGCLLGWVMSDGTTDYFSYELANNIDPPNGTILTCTGTTDWEIHNILFTMLDPEGNEWSAMTNVHVWNKDLYGSRQ